jgi:hypothetical protein
MNTSAELVLDEEESTVSPTGNLALGLVLIAVAAVAFYGGLALLFA